VDALSLSLVFAAQFLPHVFSERIKVLPLSVCSHGHVHFLELIHAVTLAGALLSFDDYNRDYVRLGLLSQFTSIVV
jgi:hypothetical protein